MPGVTDPPANLDLEVDLIDDELLLGVRSCRSMSKIAGNIPTVIRAEDI